MPDHSPTNGSDPFTNGRMVDWKDITAAHTSPSFSLPFLGHDQVIVRLRSHLLAAYAKTGKTTLLLHTIRSWVDLLGVACPDVLWLSEESEAIWGNRKQRSGWDSLPITVYYGLGESPDQLLSAACYMPHEVVIIDTVTMLMGIEDINSNTIVSRHMGKWLRPMQEKNKTPIFVHHTRKSEGLGFGIAVSGAHAFVGSVDMVLEVREHPKIANRRVVTPKGRLECPPRLLYDYSRGELVPLGTDNDLDVQSYRAGQAPWTRATT